MTPSTPKILLPPSKRSSDADASSTRKRIRTSPSAQDSSSNELMSLRGGTYTPAAGTWQRPRAVPSSQDRFFSNLGRVPINATTGVPAPLRTAPQALAQVRQGNQAAQAQVLTAAGTQIGPGGITPGITPVTDANQPHGIDDNAGRPNQATARATRRRRNTIDTLSTPGITPGITPAPPRFTIPNGAGVGAGARERGGGGDAGTGAPPNDPGPDSDWQYPDPRWNTDRQILDGWRNLEGLISRYVNDVIVDSIPDIDTTHLAFPYEVYTRLSDLAGPIVRNERYAKYMFQVSLWNYLSGTFLSHLATEWACEDKEINPLGQRTKGLAETIASLTYDHSIDPTATIPRREREKWYRWRKDTIDIVYGWLRRHNDYEQTVDNAVHDIVSLYQGYFKPAFADGTRDSNDRLVWRTTEVVTLAVELSIMMRRSQDGTWSPFIPLRGHVVMPEAIIRHRDTDVSLPLGQTEVRADSMITLTVVPGLAKYEMRNVVVDDDAAQLLVQNTVIRKMVRMKAQCLIDITETQTGALREGDIWNPDDL